MATFLEAMIHSVQPSIAEGRDATLLREVVSNTAVHVSSGLTNQPEVQAEILRVLGQSFFQLGDYTNAHKMLQQTLELRRAVFGNEDSRVADSALDAAGALAKLGRWDEAEPLARLGGRYSKKTSGTDESKIRRSTGGSGDHPERRRKVRRGNRPRTPGIGHLVAADVNPLHFCH